jgi:hypothetical protein
MDIVVRTQQLLSRAAVLADSARARIERSSSALLAPELGWRRAEPTAPSSVILVSRGPVGGSETRDTV